MTRDGMAIAARAILDGKGKPVTLHVRRIPGYSTTEVTTDIPTGRFRFAYSTVGTYDLDITLRELKYDLLAAERELRDNGRIVIEEAA